MGLIADIHRSSMGDCSNGGISGRADGVTIVNAEGPFEPTSDRPAVALLAGHGPGGTVRAVPVIYNAEAAGYEPIEPEGTVGPMMGGCYIATPDSRFRHAIEEITGAPFYGAVALHDRYETPAQYAQLSA